MGDKMKRFKPQLSALNKNSVDDEDGLLDRHNDDLEECLASNDLSSPCHRFNMTRMVTFNNFNSGEQQEEHELILNDPTSYCLEETSKPKDRQHKQLLHYNTPSKSIQKTSLSSIDPSFVSLPTIPPSKHDV